MNDDDDYLGGLGHPYLIGTNRYSRLLRTDRQPRRVAALDRLMCERIPAYPHGIPGPMPPRPLIDAAEEEARRASQAARYLERRAERIAAEEEASRAFEVMRNRQRKAERIAGAGITLTPREHEPPPVRRVSRVWPPGDHRGDLDRFFAASHVLYGGAVDDADPLIHIGQFAGDGYAQLACRYYPLLGRWRRMSLSVPVMPGQVCRNCLLSWHGHTNDDRIRELFLAGRVTPTVSGAVIYNATCICGWEFGSADWTEAAEAGEAHRCTPSQPGLIDLYQVASMLHEAALRGDDAPD